MTEILSQYLEKLGVEKIMTIGLDKDSKMLRHFEGQDFRISFLNQEQESLDSLIAGYVDFKPSSDLVIVKIPAYMSTKEALLLLGIIRNNSNCPICFLNHEDRLRFNDLIGLGFVRQNSELFTYDIATYNKKRDWNNSRFWANPELFGKYWW